MRSVPIMECGVERRHVVKKMPIIRQYNIPIIPMTAKTFPVSFSPSFSPHGMVNLSLKDKLSTSTLNFCRQSRQSYTPPICNVENSYTVSPNVSKSSTANVTKGLNFMEESISQIVADIKDEYPTSSNRKCEGPLDFSVRRRNSSRGCGVHSSASSSSSLSLDTSGLPKSNFMFSPLSEAQVSNSQTIISRLSPTWIQTATCKQLCNIPYHEQDRASFSKLSGAKSSSISQEATNNVCHPYGCHLPTSKICFQNIPLSTCFSTNNSITDSRENITPAFAAILSQNETMFSSINDITSSFMKHRLTGVNGGKVQRPFKAYPKEVLQLPLGCLGFPSMNPFLSIDKHCSHDLSVGQKEIMALYKQQLDFLREQEKQMINGKQYGIVSQKSSIDLSDKTVSMSNLKSNCSSHSLDNLPPSFNTISHPSTLLDLHVPDVVSSVSSALSLAHDLSPTSQNNPTQSLLISSSYSHAFNFAVDGIVQSSPMTHMPQLSARLSSTSPAFSTPTPPTLISSSILSSGRKRPRLLSEDQKDDAYWERRRKNNDAAKRSRNARRTKEDDIALRAALLEQENLKLRVEVAALKTEAARLRCMLYSA